MAVHLHFAHQGEILEVTSSGSWEQNQEFFDVLDCLLKKIEEVKPKAILWKSNAKKKMGLDMAMKFSMKMNQIVEQVFIAYVPNPTDDDYDVRNFTISKKVVSRGRVIGDIFYDEDEAKEWLIHQIRQSAEA